MFYDLIYVLVNFLSMNIWMPLHIAWDIEAPTFLANQIFSLNIYKS